MKNALSFSALLLFLTVFFSRCTPDQDYLYTTKEIITRGTWSVDYYYADHDRSALYSPYELSFVGDGTLEIRSTSATVKGTWNMIRDEKGTDQLLLTISDSDPLLSALTQRWSVTDKTTNVVAMKTPGSNSAEFRIRQR